VANGRSFTRLLEQLRTGTAESDDALGGSEGSRAESLYRVRPIANVATATTAESAPVCIGELEVLRIPLERGAMFAQLFFVSNPVHGAAA
jgi:hypothetical protein